MTLPAPSDRTIWQYWETRGTKPAFVDGLLDIARRVSGLEVIQVTPETLPHYLPDISPAVLTIPELAHKADMIRSRLVERHGGMWLDSDAIVLRDLNWILDLARSSDFVGFNDGGRLRKGHPLVRINCFAAPKGSTVVAEWVAAQEAMLDRQSFGWTEIGSETLHPICLQHRERVKILPFETISPVAWDRVKLFASPWRTPRRGIEDVQIVMLSNKSLGERFPELREMTVEDIEAADIYVSHYLRRAKDPKYVPPHGWMNWMRKLRGG